MATDLDRPVHGYMTLKDALGAVFDKLFRLEQGQSKLEQKLQHSEQLDHGRCRSLGYRPRELRDEGSYRTRRTTGRATRFGSVDCGEGGRLR